MSYLPALVERDQIIEGNSKLEITRSASQIGGPGVAGGLIEVFTAPYAVLVDAVSFLGSGLFVLRIRKQEEVVASTADGSKTSVWTELKEGLRFVLGNPNLRAQAGCTATSNFFSSVAFSIIIVYAVRELGLSAGAIGLIFSLAGALAPWSPPSAPPAYPAASGSGRRRSALCLLWGPAALLYAFAPEGNASIPFFFVAGLVLGFAIVVYNIVQVSYRQAICPPRLQGRMNSVDALHRLGDDPDSGRSRAARSAPGSACARPSWSARSAAAWQSSGSSSRRSATSARCPSRSRTSRGRTSSGPARPGLADPLAPVDAS